MSSTILVVSDLEQEISLLRLACKEEEFYLKQISSLEEIPARDELDPDLVIFSSGVSMAEIKKILPQGNLRERLLLFLLPESWNELSSLAPLGAISSSASVAEVRYRIQEAMQRRSNELLSRLGLASNQREGSVWDMLPSTDWVTGVNNRMRFLQELKKTISRSKRYQRPMCCLLSRIDNYDEAREREGGDVMDDILEELAGVLEISIRDADVLGRISDDLFALILPETDKDNAKHVENRIVERFGTFQFRHTLKNPLHFSFGLAALDSSELSLEGLLGSAQNALDSHPTGTSSHSAFKG